MYVDDMLVKSKDEANHLDDLKETFNTLCKYNKIMIDKEDQEKTIFITSQGLYCYKVMPFRLKNARSMY